MASVTSSGSKIIPYPQRIGNIKAGCQALEASLAGRRYQQAIALCLSLISQVRRVCRIAQYINGPSQVMDTSTTCYSLADLTAGLNAMDTSPYRWRQLSAILQRLYNQSYRSQIKAFSTLLKTAADEASPRDSEKIQAQFSSLEERAKSGSLPISELESYLRMLDKAKVPIEYTRSHQVVFRTLNWERWCWAFSFYCLAPPILKEILDASIVSLPDEMPEEVMGIFIHYFYLDRMDWSQYSTRSLVIALHYVYDWEWTFIEDDLTEQVESRVALTDSKAVLNLVKELSYFHRLQDIRERCVTLQALLNQRRYEAAASHCLRLIEKIVRIYTQNKRSIILDRIPIMLDSQKTIVALADEIMATGRNHQHMERVRELRHFLINLQKEIEALAKFEALLNETRRGRYLLDSEVNAYFGALEKGEIGSSLEWLKEYIRILASHAPIKYIKKYSVTFRTPEWRVDCWKFLFYTQAPQALKDLNLKGEILFPVSVGKEFLRFLRSYFYLEKVQWNHYSTTTLATALHYAYEWKWTPLQNELERVVGSKMLVEDICAIIAVAKAFNDQHLRRLMTGV